MALPLLFPWSYDQFETPTVDTHMKHLPVILKLSCVAATCLALSAHAQNIVSDPGFEASADGLGAHPFSSSWTVVDTTGNQPPGVPGSNSNVGGDSSFAHSGNNYANLGATPTVGSLSQLLTTTTQRYNITFWLANSSTVPISTFQAFFGGSLIYSTTGATFGGSGIYTQVSLSNVLGAAASSLLQFQYRHDDDFWRLDDISVTPTPEGGAPLWLAIPIFGGLCLLHHRLRRMPAAVS